jgi:hypothetical protein
MKKKCNSTRKNGRFTAIFAAVICLCMLFAACKDDPPPPNPPSFGSENTTVTLSPTAMGSAGAPIPLSTSVTADNLAWTCTKYTPASGVNSPYMPNDVTALISNAGTKSASVTVKKAGTYEFTLTASNIGSTAVTKTVTVVVNGYEYTATLNNVGVSFPVFIAGATSMSFAPTYAPTNNEWKEFSASDITYTITCAELSKTYNSGNGFTANISDGYANSTTYTFTQTFTVKDNDDYDTGGSQVIRARVLAGNFSQLRDADNTPLDPEVIPSVTLSLSKTVTKVDLSE